MPGSYGGYTSLYSWDYNRDIQTYGNVGIGTSANYKLEVNGMVGIDGNGTANYLGTSGSALCLTSGGVCTTGAGTPSILEDYGINLVGNGGTQPVRISNAALLVGYGNYGSSYGSGNLLVSGNVGIGTTGPNNNLQIGSQTSASTSTPVTLSLGGTYRSTAGANPKLKLWDNGSSYYGLGVSNEELDLIAEQSSSQMAFYVNANTSPSLLINSSGNVGIGTTNPTTALQVNGTITATGFSGTGTLSGGTQYYIPMWNSATALTNSVMYQSGGNVGIGTTGPITPLTVLGSGTDLSLMYSGVTTPAFIDVNSGGSALFSSNLNGSNVISDTTKPQWRMTLSQSADAFEIQRNPPASTWSSATYQNFLYINNSGAVGIGTTSPFATLSVGG